VRREAGDVVVAGRQAGHACPRGRKRVLLGLGAEQPHRCRRVEAADVLAVRRAVRPTVRRR
jgi:hypothetical protein